MEYTWVEVEILDGKLDICTDEMRVKITINYCRCVAKGLRTKWKQNLRA